MTRFHRLELDESKQAHEQQAATNAAQQRQQPDTVDEQHWMRLADESRRNGRFEEALKLYSRALEMEKSLVAAWVGQVQMLIRLEEYPEAELWSRKALELFKNNPDLLAGRAQALCRKGNLQEAQPCCDAAIGQQGQSVYPWIVRGELMLARRENLDEYCFDKAVQLDADWLVPLEISDIYLHYHQPTKALARSRAAVEKAPGQAYCWYVQGVCELALGFTSSAQKSFKHCLELAPRHPEAQRCLNELAANSSWSPGRALRRLFRR